MIGYHGGLSFAEIVELCQTSAMASTCMVLGESNVGIREISLGRSMHWLLDERRI